MDHAGLQTGADLDQRFGRLKLIAQGSWIHEVGRNKAMDCVAEGKLAGQRLQPVHPFPNDLAATDKIDAGQTKLDSIDSKTGQTAKIRFEAMKFPVD